MRITGDTYMHVERRWTRTRLRGRRRWSWARSVGEREGVWEAEAREGRAVRRLAAIVALVALTGCSSSEPMQTAPPQTGPTEDPTGATGPEAIGEPANVTRVIDGDTIEVALDGEIVDVRLIGIDTPETVDPRSLSGATGRPPQGSRRMRSKARRSGSSSTSSASTATAARSRTSGSATSCSTRRSSLGGSRR